MTKSDVQQKPSQKDWVSETLHDGVEISFRVDKVLYEQKTDEWHLELIENSFFGKVLMLDGITQVTTRDEFIYHEMMAHVPILSHGNAKEVLIIGGGDCGMAEEVLKHKSVSRLTQVEIDRSVVDFSKEHFANFNAPVFEDERFDLIIADGAQFVHETDRRFDVILIDSTDPVGPGAVLFTEEFYRGCHLCLKEGGVLVTQNGVTFMQRDELVSSISHFNKIFKEVSAYVACIPTYFGGHMALGWATDNDALNKIPVEVVKKRFEEANFTTQYYTPEVHIAAFALPKYILDAVKEGKS